MFFFGLVFQLLCLIGEAFDELSDDICGATINIRNKGDKLGLWTRDARKGDATVKIGYVYLTPLILQVEDNTMLPKPPRF